MSSISGEVAVRSATPADAPACLALLEELGRPAVAGHEDAFSEVFVRYLARTDADLLVAEVDGVVAGLCDIEYRTRLNFVRPQAWIPDLIVSEASRGKGVGAALLNEAERRARARDCWGMTLESARWRERAHAFYRREGWTDGGLSFAKSLTGEPWPPGPR